MATTAAEKVADQAGVVEKQPEKHSQEKEKTGVRRALGRGLESLLPGPRVVRPAEPSSVPVQGGQQVPFDSASPQVGDASVPDADEQQVPLRSFGSVRNDIPQAGEPRSAGTGKAPVPTQSVPTQDLPHAPITIHAHAETRTPGNLVVSIPLDHIDKNPYQTRYLFDPELLQELAESIKAQGVVQPVVVRPGEEEGRYILILGERRCRASRIAGKTSIPAIVKRVSAQQAAEMTVIENLQRQDLNCLEQAEAFRVLSKEFNLTQQQIGDRVGMSRESVANYMRLLRLPQRVLEYLGNNQMGFSEARQLLTLENPEVIAKAADEVVRKHLSIEQIEDLVIRLEALPLPAEPKKGGARWVDPNVRAAQIELERLLGLRVRIRDRKGKGKIVIEYATVDDYDRVVAMLKGR